MWNTVVFMISGRSLPACSLGYQPSGKVSCSCIHFSLECFIHHCLHNCNFAIPFTSFFLSLANSSIFQHQGLLISGSFWLILIPSLLKIPLKHQLFKYVLMLCFTSIFNFAFLCLISLMTLLKECARLLCTFLKRLEEGTNLVVFCLINTQKYKCGGDFLTKKRVLASDCEALSFVYVVRGLHRK